jgi:protein involved in polysaccharide export with SLBB domain
MVLAASVLPAAAQVSSMQAVDPQASQAFMNALSKGDVQAMHKMLDDLGKAKAPVSAEPAPVRPSERKPSLVERTLSGNLPTADAPLQQFGYEAFLRTTSTFFTPTSVPVGPDYLIGPGDQFTLTLWGTAEGIFMVQVTKEGEITLPKVGVVSVAGLRFGDLERTIRRHLLRYYSNFNLSVAMGNLRTMTVYVVGEVANPGSYALSSLSTVYSALFAAGGPTKQGSLRKIQVLRSGKVVKTLDLYDFLLQGDKSHDIRLQQEDTIFVPLIGEVVGVAGTVYRPAIYELKGGETIGDLIRTAGGLMPVTLGSRLQLARFEDNERKVVKDIKVDMTSTAASKDGALSDKVRGMDMLTILPIYDKVWEMVSLRGSVQHPGEYQWRTDLKLREVILLGQPLPTADLQKADVIRIKDGLRDREVITVDLAALLAGPGSGQEDILLRPRDQIRVYSAYRETEAISLSGEIVRPGTFEIQSGERLSDLLRRAGGFTAEAYPYGAVFKRRDVKDAQDKNLRAFISRMQSQILQSAAGGTAAAVSAEEASFARSELAMNQGLLENLKRMQEQFEGRVAITLSANIEQWAGTKDDLVLKDGDALYVPKRAQEVMIMGEVHSPGAQLYLPGQKVGRYLAATGGPTTFADKEQVFVIQANGYAFSGDSPSVGDIENVELQAGDTIFVPQDLERHASMRLTKDIVDIMFKTAVIIATITILF